MVVNRPPSLIKNNKKILLWSCFIYIIICSMNKDFNVEENMKELDVLLRQQNSVTEDWLCKSRKAMA